ncbi:MAG: acyltransferase [Terracidiphilus sp.]|jgi:acetyltransferase-like isoleucine patch superfamily enzyme
MSVDQSATEAGVIAAARPSLRRRLATSQGRFARFARWGYRSLNNFAIPAPKFLLLPVIWLCQSVLNVYYFLMRVLICEPFFKASCTKYGRNLHTGAHIISIGGKGNIIIGDNVTLDGNIGIGFAARFSDHPTLEIGDNSGIGHGCYFTIGKRISIGRDCTLSGGISIWDSNAHDTDPASRLAHRPPNPEDVRPVEIRDRVWVGRQCLIFPGVKIGEGSVISAGSVVRSHVPPYSVVAGNPAKVMFRLKKPDQSRVAN